VLRRLLSLGSRHVSGRRCDRGVVVHRER
jgi:hypothetical protein